MFNQIRHKTASSSSSHKSSRTLPRLQAISFLLFLLIFLDYPSFSNRQELGLTVDIQFYQQSKLARVSKLTLWSNQQRYVKVDFERQNSFSGLSQTIKFLLEELYGASSPYADFPSIAAYLSTTDEKK
jgi:hypothetical protein